MAFSITILTIFTIISTIIANTTILITTITTATINITITSTALWSSENADTLGCSLPHQFPSSCLSPLPLEQGCVFSEPQHQPSP